MSVITGGKMCGEEMFNLLKTYQVINFDLQSGRVENE